MLWHSHELLFLITWTNIMAGKGWTFSVSVRYWLNHNSWCSDVSYKDDVTAPCKDIQWRFISHQVCNTSVHDKWFVTLWVDPLALNVTNVMYSVMLEILNVISAHMESPCDFWSFDCQRVKIQYCDTEFYFIVCWSIWISVLRVLVLVTGDYES